MCKWNLHKLAEMFDPYVPLPLGKSIVDHFDDLYESHYVELMSYKLGLVFHDDRDDDNISLSMYESIGIIEGLFEVMKRTYADFTGEHSWPHDVE